LIESLASAAGDDSAVCEEATEDAIVRKSANVKDTKSGAHEKTRFLRLSRKERKVCDSSLNENTTILSSAHVVSIIDP
jgi:hypothetical protein